MSNQPNKPATKLAKMNQRAARPLTLAGALGDLMQIFGARASDADLATRWDEIMGPDIASIARLAAIKKTRDNKYNIVIRPITPAFALPLSYQTREITEKLNKYFGQNAIGKITFRK